MHRYGFIAHLFAATVTIAVFLSSTANAGYPYDISLVGLGRPDVDPYAQGRFRALCNELAIALAPRPLQPAETLGVSGFEFSLSNSLTSVSNKSDYWRAMYGPVINAPMRDRTILEQLWTPTLHIRKGLPFSTEFGVQASYLAFTELYMLGAEFKAALHESYIPQLPALAARVAGARLLGASQISMFSLEADLMASYAFSVGGMSEITPYIGYGQLRVNAESSKIDATPYSVSDPNDQQGGSNGSLYSFEQVRWQKNWTTRYFGGLRINASTIEVLYEFSFSTMTFRKYDKQIISNSIKIGFDV
ncbi:MAG: hypothetical protein JW841_18350 [Deltaproteobacteria bacterium]|nr:hypothetical protein [Deltaproteobacteria bacterium]